MKFLSSRRPVAPGREGIGVWHTARPDAFVSQRRTPARLHDASVRRPQEFWSEATVHALYSSPYTHMSTRPWIGHRLRLNTAGNANPTHHELNKIPATPRCKEPQRNHERRRPSSDPRPAGPGLSVSPNFQQLLVETGEGAAAGYPLDRGTYCI
jgi:hypothetical protein